MDVRIGVTDATNVARFRDDEQGATAIEYSIVAAGIAIAVAGTIRVLGATVLTNLYNQIAAAF
jgi:pilus assembly protein Flp/PilA